MRPGEKLEEILWESDAEVAPTANPDILRVSEKESFSPLAVHNAVVALRAAAEREDRAGAEAILRECVPTFAPSVPLASAESERTSPRLIRSGEAV
jgi:FlaA1/EpsC-like NDP-sugar epimerase